MIWEPKHLLGFASLITVVACGAAPGDDTEELGENDGALARSGDLADAEIPVTTRPVKTVGTIGTVVATPLIPATGSDLTLDDSVMHFDAGAQQGLDIHVINVGELPTLPAAAAVTVDGIRFVGHVYPYWPATSPADSLVPQTHGYIHVAIPQATLKLNHCTPYKVHIDVDHTMQVASASRPDVLSNDTGYSWTQCLTWLTPVSSAVMGEAIITALADQTLHRVVSSYVSGRNDGQLCSSCHFRNATNNYRPEIDQNTSGINILADTVVGGGTWQGGTESWSYKFLNAPYPHTDELRAAVTRWRQDVVRQRFGQLKILTGEVAVTSTQLLQP